MKLEYVVHGRSVSTRYAEVEVNGSLLEAQVKVYEIELVPVDEMSGTLKLVTTDAQVVFGFEPGQTVVGNFEVKA